MDLLVPVRPLKMGLLDLNERGEFGRLNDGLFKVADIFKSTTHGCTNVSYSTP